MCRFFSLAFFFVLAFFNRGNCFESLSQISNESDLSSKKVCIQGVVRGERGHRGHRGKKGERGHRGHKGRQGPCCNSTCIYGAPREIFVDGNTSVATSDQNGSICSPYATIQQAINTIPAATNIDELYLGHTILIASGEYNETLTINGDSKRIDLVGLGTVIIGDSTNTHNLTWNLSASNTNFGIKNVHPTLGIKCINQPGRGFVTFGDLTSRFIINGDVIISNASSNISNFEFTGTVSKGITVTSGPIDLYLYNASVFKNIVGSSETDLQVAENCVFQGLITVQNYGIVQSCVLEQGMTLTTTNPGGSGGNPDGMLLTYIPIGATLTGPVFSEFRMDFYTNYWVKTNAIPIAGGAVKVLLSDALP